MKSSLEDDVYNLLLEKKYETILELLKNPENEPILKNRVWNLINTICLTVKTNKILERESDLALCKKILLCVINHGNPREIIVALMEEADSFKEHSFFCLLLEPLKETLKKVPTKRGKSLEWVLSTLNAHIELLPPPKNYDLEGEEERTLLDVTPEVVDANFVLSNYYSFVDFFVEEVSYEKESAALLDKSEYQREILRKYILRLFHHPFLYLDLHREDETKSKSTTRVLCESYLKCLFKMCRNVFNLYKYGQSFSIRKNINNDDDEDREESVSILAFSNLSYLIFVEKLAIVFQPFVYSHKHNFMNSLKYLNCLLCETNINALFKGLLLAHELLDHLENFEISYSCVEVCTGLSRQLLNIAIHCPVKCHRQTAINNFLSFIKKCDWKARYHLILQVVCTVNHSGCVGLAIDLFKNYLHININDPQSYFLGKNLMLFMKKIFVLPGGAETDLLENSDRIMSTLNFLRYLALRDDRRENRTGIWDIIELVSRSYLNPLLEAINLSRAHYKETAKQTELDKKNRKTEKTFVTVNNTAVPDVAWKEICEKALLNFDILESLLSRVREIIES